MDKLAAFKPAEANQLHRPAKGWGDVDIAPAYEDGRQPEFTSVDPASVALANGLVFDGETPLATVTERPKRTRRTREQIAADKAAAEAAAAAAE
jgi:hypothetical protein